MSAYSRQNFCENLHETLRRWSYAIVVEILIPPRSAQRQHQTYSSLYLSFEPTFLEVTIKFISSLKIMTVATIL